MLLCQVLEEEFVSLHGPLPYQPSWLFTPDQLPQDEGGQARLLKTLRARQDPLSAYLLQCLGADNLRSTPALVEKLNSLLGGPCLFEARRFAHVRLSEETYQRIELKLPGESEGIFLNRTLLEEAYPGDLQPIREVRLRQVYAAIHQLNAEPDRERASDDPRGIFIPRRAAICFSGGGIRSATFGLGVLQALARRGVLPRFDFLSTVSGGGYLGSWFSAWVHRHSKGLPGVIQELCPTPPSASGPHPSPQAPLEPEPAPIRHLRAYSNYLTPKLGSLSADSWTLVATYLRNLFLNWLVIIPLILAVLAIPRLMATVLRAGGSDGMQQAALWLASLGAVTAIAYAAASRPGASEAAAVRRSAFWRYAQRQEGFLCFCLTPLLLAAMGFQLYWAWDRAAAAPPPSWWRFILFGAGLHLAGWVLGALALVWQETGSLAGRLWQHLWRREILWVAATGAVGGSVLGWAALEVFPSPAGAAATVVTSSLYASLGTPIFVGLFLLTATVFVGVVSRWTSDDDREWWGRMGAWALIAMVAWLALFGLVIFGPVGLVWLNWKWNMAVGSAGGLSGLLAVLLGRSAKTPASKSDSETFDVKAKLMSTLAAAAAPLFILCFLVLLSFLTSLALSWLATTPFGGGFFTASPEFLKNPEGPLRLVCFTDWSLVALFILGIGGFGVGMSALLNVNKFSLHSMYRDRLIRAYLGASRLARNPNPFTGFDPDDSFPMHEMRQGLVHLDHLRHPAELVLKLRDSADPLIVAVREHLLGMPKLLAMIQRYEASQPPPDLLLREMVEEFNTLIRGGGSGESEDREVPPPFVSSNGLPGDDLIYKNRQLLEAAFPDELVKTPPPPRRPLHIINIALNLVKGTNLAWQERKAETFTVSALHAGNYQLGYRRAENYGRNSKTGRAISLGTAVTISGAAASPNMGYHSSPVVTFLLTLFNVRLGWWLGNPAIHGQRTSDLSCPTFSVGPMIQEALGLTDDKSHYVYLSDGGHFENLGLYEMVLRRSPFIVVSDAGCDPKCVFEDLGNAIRKIRIDLGVPITLKDPPPRIYPRQDEGKVSRYCAIGTIHYKEVDGLSACNGVLAYLKPAIAPGQPMDVFNYSKGSEAFPHESTGDQFFSESQFESYRMLGCHVVDEIYRVGGPLRQNLNLPVDPLMKFVESMEGYLRAQ